MIDERALQIAFCHHPAPFDPQELEDVGVPKLCGRGFGQSAVPARRGARGLETDCTRNRQTSGNSQGPVQIRQTSGEFPLSDRPL
jgi:hypothetical protein